MTTLLLSEIFSFSLFGYTPNLLSFKSTTDRYIVVCENPPDSNFLHARLWNRPISFTLLWLVPYLCPDLSLCFYVSEYHVMKQFFKPIFANLTLSDPGKTRRGASSFKISTELLRVSSTCILCPISVASVCHSLQFPFSHHIGKACFGTANSGRFRFPASFYCWQAVDWSLKLPWYSHTLLNPDMVNWLLAMKCVSSAIREAWTKSSAQHECAGRRHTYTFSAAR